MSDAFSCLVDVLAAARRVVQPRRDDAIEKSPAPGGEFVFRRRLSTIAAFIASPASTELTMLLIWSLSALLFAFAYGDPRLGSEFLPGVAMN